MINTTASLARHPDSPFISFVPCKPKPIKSRISRASLVHAIAKVRAMDMRQREELIDEVACNQPNIHACVLMQKRFGVSHEKLNHLLYIMLVCFQAMKESELVWPVIGVSEIDRHMPVYIGLVKCDEYMESGTRDKKLSRYIDDHPERELFAYVYEETAHWHTTIVPEYTDKYIMIVAATLVTCIAYAPMAATRRSVTLRVAPMRDMGLMQ
jgi:hypothetical protein